MNDETKKRLEEDPEFLADYLKGSFVADVSQAMEEDSLSKNSLARRMGTSRQYVGKILDEEDPNNFTIDSIARIAAALGRDVSLRLKKYEEIVEIKAYEQWKFEKEDFVWLHQQLITGIERVAEEDYSREILLEQQSETINWRIVEVPPPEHADYRQEDASDHSAIAVPMEEEA